jgi:hypothetical protein
MCELTKWFEGGDPTGTGKGGQSIYGGYFKDEFVDTLKVHKYFVVITWNERKKIFEWQWKNSWYKRS